MAGKRPVHDSFDDAREDCQEWIDQDHERSDHPSKEAPDDTYLNVTDGDYTYIIREAAG